MKKFNFLILALIVGIGFSACSKDKTEYYDPQKQLAEEAPILKLYVDTTEGLGLGNTKLDEATGIWYQIIEEGLANTEDEDYYEYNLNNANQLEFPDVRVKYTGKLVANGFVFEELDMNDSKYDGKYMNLYTTIGGWQVAFFPKEVKQKDGEMIEIGGVTVNGLQKGSKIRVIIPSPWAYGNQSSSSLIPANSPLDFTIEVLEVKAPGNTN